MVALPQRAVAGRLRLGERNWRRDCRTVVGVKRIGIFGERDIGARAFEALDIAAAWRDPDIVVGNAVEEADRRRSHFVIVAILHVAWRIEPNVRRKPHRGWIVELAE